MGEIGRIRKELKRLKLPAWVDGTRVEPMIDHSGEHALRITIVLAAGHEAKAHDGSALMALTRRIRAAVDAAGVRLFAYTRFVGASELAA